MDFGFLNSEEHSVDSKFDEYLVSLNHLVDKHCLKKKLNEKTLKLRNKPWINSQILKIMRILDNLFQQFKQTESPETYSFHKKFRNRIVNE